MYTGDERIDSPAWQFNVDQSATQRRPSPATTSLMG
jgi:hypothetical protein